MFERVALVMGIIALLVQLFGGFRFMLNEFRNWRNKGKWLVVLMLSLTPSIGHAACSGSGLVFTCDNTSTVAQINSAIASASNTAVVTLQSGTYNLTNVIDLTPRNGITVICETVRACTLSRANDIFTLNPITSTITALTRISGFVVTGASGTAKLWFYGQNNIENLRIDNNTFSLPGGSQGLLLGGAGSTGRMYGVIDHNLFTSTTGNFASIFNIGGDGVAWPVGLLGSALNLFIEDNDFQMSGGTYDAGTGCFDGYKTASTVVRFNTFNGCRILSHGFYHDGPPAWEAYGNTLQSPDGYRLIHHQGSGEWMVWGNNLTGSGHIELQHYRSSTNPNGNGPTHACDGVLTLFADGSRTPTTTYRGYPCYRQPGRDNNANLSPVYFWKNIQDGTTNVVPIKSGNDPVQYLNEHIATDRDWYRGVSKDAQTNATTPFDGTTGTGFGTLANRPTTCTPTPEALDAGRGGVGYWATNQGSWNTSTSNPYGVQFNGEDGLLYTCSATNTWSNTYTPYTYPHPLQGASPAEATASSPVVIGRVLRWMEIILPVIGLGFHFRRPLAYACIALFAATTTLSVATWQTTKIESKGTALVILTTFNHLTKRVP